MQSNITDPRKIRLTCLELAVQTCGTNAVIPFDGQKPDVVALAKQFEAYIIGGPEVPKIKAA